MDIKFSEQELSYLKNCVRSKIVEDTKMESVVMGAEAQDAAWDDIHLGWDIFKKVCKELREEEPDGKL